MTCSEERSIKLARVRELIEKLGFDALYCKRQDDFAWLTCGGINYVGLGEMGNCGLLITRENTYAITNCIEAPRMRDAEQREEWGFELPYGVWRDDAGDRGLIICCTRLLNFVPVTQQLREQYLANVEIDCTLMANSIPGHTFVSALEAGRAAYAARGYAAEFDKHHQGGPIGYAGRDYRVGFNTPGVIAENQAFCWNPSITGTKSEDTVIATSAGIIPVSRPILFPTLSLTVCGQKFVRPAIWEV